MSSSRQLYVKDQTIEQIEIQSRLTLSYLVFMSMGGILAAVAILTDSVPILIGAMVIAPALPPLNLVAVSLVCGKPRLALRGLSTGLTGILVATIFTMLTTYILDLTNVIPPEIEAMDKWLLEERVQSGWYSVTAAFAAGIAGTIALAKQEQDKLVGVVAALALVPASAAAGISLMYGDLYQCLGGIKLLGTNIVCIIISGIITLLIIKPDRRD